MEITVAINLSIKGVPDAIAERLRARAEMNHRSLQGELMAIVAQAAAEFQAPAGGASPAAGAPARRLDGIRRGSKTIEQIAAEHRLQFPEPIAGGPLAVDIIREMRDSR